MLFHRHQFLYGISGIVLWWFDSYLTGRTQTVTVSGLSSRPAEISFGVQQGSVLGPIFFILYSAPLSSLIETHSVSNQSFADNIQLLRCCPPDQIHATLLTCLTQYKLRLNDNKKDALLMKSDRTIFSEAQPSFLCVTGTSDILFTACGRKLGFTILGKTLDKHILNVCLSAYVYC